MRERDGAMAASSEWQKAREAAERYERILVSTIFDPFAAVLVEAAGLKRGEAVLDCGCGTGAVARRAAGIVSTPGRIVAVDINAGMIEVARSLPPVDSAFIEWHVESASQLALGDRSVDAVLCAQTLQYLAQRPAALAEMLRVLRPGGRVVLSTWCGGRENPYFHAVAEAVNRHIGPLASSGISATSDLTESGVIKSLLEDAGFSNVTMTVAERILDLPDLPGFISRHISATPAFHEYAKAPPEARTAVVRDVTGELASFAGTAGMKIPFRANIARGVR
jgi:ubiquinone/menaquinone biosynthesis C-methylase UbiE